jgi:hypothetical protein
MLGYEGSPYSAVLSIGWKKISIFAGVEIKMQPNIHSRLGYLKIFGRRRF